MHLYFCQSYFFLLYFSYFGAITSHIECNRVESCSTYFRITPTYLDIKAFRPSITHFLIKQYQSKPDVQYHKRERIKKTLGIYLQCCIFHTVTSYLEPIPFPICKEQLFSSVGGRGALAGVS